MHPRAHERSAQACRWSLPLVSLAGAQASFTHAGHELYDTLQRVPTLCMLPDNSLCLAARQESPSPDPSFAARASQDAQSGGGGATAPPSRAASHDAAAARDRSRRSLSEWATSSGRSLVRAASAASEPPWVPVRPLFAARWRRSGGERGGSRHRGLQPPLPASASGALPAGLSVQLSRYSDISEARASANEVAPGDGGAATGTHSVGRTPSADRNGVPTPGTPAASEIVGAAGPRGVGGAALAEGPSISGAVAAAGPFAARPPARRSDDEAAAVVWRAFTRSAPADALELVHVATLPPERRPSLAPSAEPPTPPGAAPFAVAASGGGASRHAAALARDAAATAVEVGGREPAWGPDVYFFYRVDVDMPRGALPWLDSVGGEQAASLSPRVEGGEMGGPL